MLGLPPRFEADAGPRPPSLHPEAAGGEPPGFAVLVGLLEREGEEHILLTKRPDGLPQYPGQVSFPGGARDPEDADLAATAFRETHEEVGIEPARVRLLEELPCQTTGLGHCVKPFLALIGSGPIVPNPVEVERILYLPLSLVLADPFRPREASDLRGRIRSTWSFRFEGLEVWGLTARILRERFVERGSLAIPPRAGFG